MNREAFAILCRCISIGLSAALMACGAQSPTPSVPAAPFRLERESSWFFLGETTRLTATGGAGQTTWRVDSPLASLTPESDGSALLEASAAGKYAVTAERGGQSASLEFEALVPVPASQAKLPQVRPLAVGDVQSVSIARSPASGSVASGDNARLTATVKLSAGVPADQGYVSWTVVPSGGALTVGAGNPNLASFTSCDPGLPKTYTLTATSLSDPGKTASSTVTVTARAPQVNAVTLAASSANLVTGQASTLTAKLSGTCAFDRSLNWTVTPDDPGVNLSVQPTGAASFSSSSAGSFVVKAASVLNPAKSASVTINVAPSDTTPPTVTLTTTAGSGVTAPRSITLNASAKDNLGVSRVEFYDGASLLGTDATSPFQLNVPLTSASNGTKTYTARAYDAAGNAGASAPVSVGVNIPSGPPLAVSLTASSSLVTAIGKLTLSATVSSAKPVKKVEFYAGGVLKGTDASAPYSLAVALSSADNGHKSYTAKVYDTTTPTSLSATSDPVSVTVNIDAQAPSVSLTGSTSNLSAPGTVVLTASASDNLGVTKVEFYNGTARIATKTARPYTLALSFNQGTTGTPSYTAKAYDAAGNSTLSSAFVLNVNIPPAVDTVPPTITDFNSSNTNVTSSGPITLTATATDNVGIARVEFFDLTGGGNTSLGAVNASPYALSVNLTSSDNGTKTYEAVAFDAAGNSAASAPVSMVVNIPVPDTTPPTVSLSASSTNVTVRSTLTLTANALDNVGVTSVEFFDGSQSLGQSTSSPFTFDITLYNNDDGDHVYSARAYDAANNQGLSDSVAVSVNIRWPVFLSGPSGIGLEPTAITTDTNGNVYAISQVSASTGYRNGVVTKIRSDGTVAWQTQFGGNYLFSVGDIATVLTPSGQTLTLVTGSSQIPVFPGGEDGFLNAFDENGGMVWSKPFNFSSGGNRGTYGAHIVVDSNHGGVYVSGLSVIDLTGSACPPYAVGCSIYRNFVARFNLTGDLDWSSFLDAVFAQYYQTGLAVDSLGNTYLAWNQDGSPSGALKKGYFTKFSSSGARLFTVQMPLADNSFIQGIGVDSGDNVYIGGYEYAQPASTNNPVEDAFVIKFDSNGSSLWRQNIFSSPPGNSSIITGLKVDIDGSIFVIGSRFDSNVGGTSFLAKFNTFGSQQYLISSVTPSYSSQLFSIYGNYVYLSYLYINRYDALTGQER